MAERLNIAKRSRDAGFLFFASEKSSDNTSQKKWGALMHNFIAHGQKQSYASVHFSIKRLQLG